MNSRRVAPAQVGDSFVLACACMGIDILSALRRYRETAGGSRTGDAATQNEAGQERSSQ